MRKLQFFATSAVLAFGLAACGGGSDGEGGSTDSSTSTTELTSDDGEKAVIKTGEDIEADFPDGFALVPGGKVIDSMDHSDGGRTTKLIRFEAPQELEELAEIYLNQAKMAGYDIRYSGESNGIHSVDGPRSDGSGGTFSFQVMKGANGANTGSLTIATE